MRSASADARRVRGHYRRRRGSGLSAALVLGRACRKVLLCDDDKPRNWASKAIYEFLTCDGIAPVDFRNAAHRECLASKPRPGPQSAVSPRGATALYRGERPSTLSDFAPCFPGAMRVRLGNRVMVFLRLAAAAALRTSRRAATSCFVLAI